MASKKIQIVGLVLPQSDWNQTDETQLDYIKNKPINVSAFTNDAGYLTEHQSLDGLATEDYVNTQVSNLVNSAPDKLNTLDELAAALGDDANFANTVTTELSKKANSADLGSLAKKSTVDKLDLSSSVQTSLNKADSALQSYTETDPTVPSWAKASTKPSYTKSEVGLGNVDNVKQYSASNPPPYPVTKVNNKTGNVALSASDVGADASGTASSTVSAHNTNTSAHADIREEISQLSFEKVDKLEVASYLTPEMYGAKGDGKTDDSAAIQAAIDAAGSTKTVYLSKKTYITNSTLNIHTSRSNFVCDGTIHYNGAGAAVKMYGMTMTNINIYAIEAPNGTALLVDSTIGEIGNCIVYINYIFSSVVGVYLKGDGGEGVSGHNIFYNKFHMEGCITSTNTCIYIEPITSLINENYFWVGRLYGGASYGIRVNAKDTFGGSAVNGNASRNVFYGGNFEGISSNGYSVHLHNSSLNIFRNFRTEEACGKYVIGLSGECYGNDIGLSRIYLKEVDISTLTDSGEFANILRSTQIVGLGDDNLSRQNKILVTTDGFSSETSDIAKSLQTETWIFTLKDGTTVEKQVAIS